MRIYLKRVFRRLRNNAIDHCDAVIIQDNDRLTMFRKQTAWKGEKVFRFRYSEKLSKDQLDCSTLQASDRLDGAMEYMLASEKTSSVDARITNQPVDSTRLSGAAIVSA